jgi:hypothetical protein
LSFSDFAFSRNCGFPTIEFFQNCDPAGGSAGSLFFVCKCDKKLQELYLFTEIYQILPPERFRASPSGQKNSLAFVLEKSIKHYPQSVSERPHRVKKPSQMSFSEALEAILETKPSPNIIPNR